MDRQRASPAASPASAARCTTQLPFLATTGSTAPFIGLFGTVWGIYHALVAIGVAGQASIDKVAGPVGEALIMTAIGLAVAVPAVLGYNYLLGRNKTIMEKVKLFANDLEQVIVSGSRVEGAGARHLAAARRSNRYLAAGGRHDGHVNFDGRWPGRGRRADVGDQHHAARGRDAGAADHLPDHDPGDHAVGQGGPAEGGEHPDADQAGEHQHRR